MLERDGKLSFVDFQKNNNFSYNKTLTHHFKVDKICSFLLVNKFHLIFVHYFFIHQNILLLNIENVAIL